MIASVILADVVWLLVSICLLLLAKAWCGVSIVRHLLHLLIVYIWVEILFHKLMEDAVAALLVYGGW